MSLTQCDSGVAAVFEDGTNAVGSVLIGCDGGRSVVRRLLVGEVKAVPKDLDISVINFTLKFDHDLADRVASQHPIAFNSYCAKNWMLWVSAVDVPDPDDAETWLFQLMFFWKGEPRKADLPDQVSRTAFLRGKANAYHKLWRRILQAIPDDASFGIDGIREWEPFDWSCEPLANRVTLAGDAAHTMAPNRGQGLNCGLEDATVLSEALARAIPSAEGVQAALRQYEAEMVPRGSLEVQISSRAAAMAHNFEILKESPLAKFGVRRSRKEDL